MSDKNLICIQGLSGTGKSASLRSLRNQDRVLYINCEAGKKLPFRHKFEEIVLTDPDELFDIIEEAEESGKFDTVIIDSLTFLLEMYESLYIYKNTDGFNVWADFQQYAKKLFQQVVPKSPMSFIFTAHVEHVMDKETGVITDIRIPVKGALKNNGLEAYFSFIVMTAKVPVKTLLKYKNDFLNITEAETNVGFKHVFQCLPTKDTTASRVRAPWDFWKPNETYIDNDAQLLLDLIQEYEEGE